MSGGSHHGRISPGSGTHVHRSHHSRGRNYKQMQLPQQQQEESWSVEREPPPQRIGLDSPSPAPGLLQSWYPRPPSSHSSSPGGGSGGGGGGGGGFMLASNITSSQQQSLYSQSSSSSSSLPPQPLPPPPPLLSSVPPSSVTSADPSSDDPPPTHWGEVKEEIREDSEIRPLWHDDWRSKGLVCSVPRLVQHPPHTHSPLEQSNLPALLDHPRDREGLNPVLHSSDLRQHIREVEHISIMSGTNLSTFNLPPLPERFGRSEVKKTPYGRGGDSLTTELNVPKTLNLDPKLVGLLLRKSTAAICSHVGYHSASLRALDTLAGVMGEFLSRLSKQLNINNQQFCSSEPALNGANIQDPLERSLWNCGIRGKTELHHYWVTEVKTRVNRLQSEAAQLHEEPPPSSLPPPPRPPRPLDFTISSWPPALGGEGIEEELSLEDALTTDMSIIAPATTPDPGTIQTFLPDLTGQEESEGFLLLTSDLPLRKRLRTGGSFTE